VTAPRNFGSLIDPARDPAKIALIDLPDGQTAREWAYADVDARANAVARGLLARGLRRGDRVAILSANRAEFLFAFLGTMRAGLCSVPVSFKFPRPTIEHVLRDAGAALVLTDEARRELCPDGLPTLALDGPGFADLLDPGPFDAVAPAAGEIALILYTSGSTGRPKGVPLVHAGQVWVMDQRAASGPDLDRQRLLVAAPMYHMNALFVSASALRVHASAVVLREFTARVYVEAIGRFRCTALTSVPTMMALVAREPDALARTDRSSVERVSMGSAPLTQALVDRVRALFPGAVITNGYGTTEAGPIAFGPHPRGIARPDVALGYPAPGVDLRLVRDGDRAADEGVLEIRTPALMPGYLNLPGKTAAVITEDGYYVTGDVMRRDPDGFYHFVGRADDMFVCGGENVYPGEVETVLERHPLIQQACVVPVADDIRGQKPVAFVVPVASAALTEREVKDWVLANAPPYQHPRHVEFALALPLAGTTKVDRGALAARARELWGPAPA
jgi:long-chain acyl-CoA synthetase